MVLPFAVRLYAAMSTMFWKLIPGAPLLLAVLLRNKHGDWISKPIAVLPEQSVPVMLGAGVPMNAGTLMPPTDEPHTLELEMDQFTASVL